MLNQRALPFVNHMLDFKPIEQTGETCKVAAIASIDQYWAARLCFPPLYVYKNTKGLYDTPRNQLTSIREIAKLTGSQQGELLEVKQVAQIFSIIGYKGKLVLCDSLRNFKDTIKKNIVASQPLICFFAVVRETGLPAAQFNDNEHACVISGYEESTNLVRISHWGRHFFCSPEALFSAMSMRV